MGFAQNIKHKIDIYSTHNSEKAFVLLFSLQNYSQFPDSGNNPSSLQQKVDKENTVYLDNENYAAFRKKLNS